METFTMLSGSLLVSVYHCFDRIVSNDYRNWAEALPAPGDHRFPLDDDEGGAPINPSPGQPCPQKAIRGGQFRSLQRTLEDAELVAAPGDGR